MNLEIKIKCDQINTHWSFDNIRILGNVEFDGIDGQKEEVGVCGSFQIFDYCASIF